MSDGTVMKPATAKVALRRVGGPEEITLTEPTYGALEPLLGQITEIITRVLNYLEQGGQSLDPGLFSNLVAQALPKQLILAATDKDEAWLKGVHIGDVPKLLDAAVEVTIHPDLFPGLKKIGETLKKKIPMLTGETSGTASTTSTPTATPTT